MHTLGGVSEILAGDVLSAPDAGSPVGGSDFEHWTIPLYIPFLLLSGLASH